MAQWLGIEATKFAWRADVETSSQRLVLLAIAKYADENGTAFPSVTSICADTRLNEKTAYKVIAELKALGVLSVTKRAVKNTNRYQLIMTAADTPKIGGTKNGTTENGGTKNGSDIPPKTDVPMPPKTEEEHIKEEKKNTLPREGSLELYGLPPALVSDWRSSRKGALTQTAVDGLKREAEKAGLSLEEALRIQLERGWSYFDGVRYRDSLASSSAAPAAEPASAPAASKKEFAGDPDEATRRYLAEHAALNVPYRSQTPEDLEAIRRQKEAEEEERDAEAIFGKRLNGGAK